MKIGFTGTQRGMTDFQKEVLEAFLRIYEDWGEELWFLHGDCIGADAEAVRIARDMKYGIWTFPPIHTAKRAWVESGRTETPREYLTRNHNIVKACDLMVAAPGEDTEVLRSGTWATIRYAKRLDKHLFLIYPKHT
jgi:hypothetical protein